jgi:rubrerythrin
MTLELDKPVGATVPESTYVEAGATYVEAGARGVGDYRCEQCGYGIVMSGVLPSCPMCQSSSWKRASPLAEH